MLTYDEALGIYFDSDEPHTSEVLGTKLQPPDWLSPRTDHDDGWHFRNINGFLATDYDHNEVAIDNGEADWISPLRNDLRVGTCSKARASDEQERQYAER